jgi:Spy/CpxP family protein refolding chaperone
VRADDTAKKDSGAAKAAAQPAAKKETKSSAQAEAKPVRLTKPWRDLTSLTDEQKQKINQIHRKSVADVKAIEQRERDEITALLNDQQKAELNALTEKEAAERKTKAAEKTKAGAKVSQKGTGKGGAAAASEEAAADDDDATRAN